MTVRYNEVRTRACVNRAESECQCVGVDQRSTRSDDHALTSKQDNPGSVWHCSASHVDPKTQALTLSQECDLGSGSLIARRSILEHESPFPVIRLLTDCCHSSPDCLAHIPLFLSPNRVWSWVTIEPT